MDISLLQALSLIITIGYMEFEIIKTNNANIQLKNDEKENNEDIKEYYDLCNSILFEILSDFDKENYPALKCPKLQFDKKEYIKTILNPHPNPQVNLLFYKLINYIDPKYLTRLLSNLKNLKVEYPKDQYFPPFYKPLGEYSDELNTIYIYDNIPSTLSHEFLHMASTVVIENYSYIGFCIKSNELEKFLNGFNEGYTEILNERIFGANFVGYKVNYLICKLLETMFDDKSELEIAYFNNDIDVFINKFLTYGTKDELSYILKQLDYFSNIPYTLNDKNKFADMVYEIISRKYEPDKILKCKQIIKENQPKEEDSIIKKLVRK